ncbi:MAG: hypothetical protein ACKVU4_04805 [Phycisphaerales bacterium]
MNPQRTTRARWGRLPVALGVLAVIACALSGGGCRDKGYSQATPDDVLVTARKMVENGDARRLSDLIYADSPQMRQLLNDLGRTAGLLAKLGRTIQAKFPKEVESLRLEAEEAAKNGRGSSFVGQMLGMANQSRRARRDPAVAQEARRTFDRMAIEVFADPYAWLTRNTDRLRASTEKMPDGTAVIQWDSDPEAEGKDDWKPVAGFGLLGMKQDRGKWYVVLPTNLPLVSGAVPKTPEEWEIASYLLEVVDNMIIDLDSDVEQGKARTLDDVARAAGEKAFLPAAFAVLAYGKAMDERNKADRAAKAASAPVPPSASPAQKR